MNSDEQIEELSEELLSTLQGRKDIFTWSVGCDSDGDLRTDLLFEVIRGLDKLPEANRFHEEIKDMLFSGVEDTCLDWWAGFSAMGLSSEARIIMRKASIDYATSIINGQ